MCMVRGNRVNVHAYPNKLLERIVWEVYETYILVCRPEVYFSALVLGVELNSLSMMGFPREDVSLC